MDDFRDENELDPDLGPAAAGGASESLGIDDEDEQYPEDDENEEDELEMNGFHEEEEAV